MKKNEVLVYFCGLNRLIGINMFPITFTSFSSFRREAVSADMLIRLYICVCVNISVCMRMIFRSLSALGAVLC